MMAFTTLKQAFVSEPVPFKVEVNASDYATGGILMQTGKDKKWHPVAYLSKSLSEMERNYDIHDKELLAIIHALASWQQYLEGAPHTIEILTDH
jgi:hypothetical protein